MSYNYRGNATPTHKTVFCVRSGDVRKVGQALEAAVLVMGNNERVDFHNEQTGSQES